MPRLTSRLKDLARKLDKDPEHQKEYRKQTPYHNLLLDVIQRRGELGITQKELADRAGMHQSQLSRIENAKHDARLSTIIKLAEALDMRVDIRLIPLIEVRRADWESLITIEATTESDTIDFEQKTADQERQQVTEWSR